MQACVAWRQMVISPPPRSRKTRLVRRYGKEYCRFVLIDREQVEELRVYLVLLAALLPATRSTLPYGRL